MSGDFLEWIRPVTSLDVRAGPDRERLREGDYGHEPGRPDRPLAGEGSGKVVKNHPPLLPECRAVRRQGVAWRPCEAPASERRPLDADGTRGGHRTAFRYDAGTLPERGIPPCPPIRRLVSQPGVAGTKRRLRTWERGRPARMDNRSGLRPVAGGTPAFPGRGPLPADGTPALPGRGPLPADGTPALPGRGLLPAGGTPVSQRDTPIPGRGPLPAGGTPVSQRDTPIPGRANPGNPASGSRQPGGGSRQPGGGKIFVVLSKVSRVRDYCSSPPS